MSSHKVPFEFYRSPLEQMPHKATTGTLVIDRMGCVIPVDTTAGAAALTLARPTKAGILGIVMLEVDNGDLTLTVTGGYNADADTSITFDDAGDYVMFYSMDIAGTKYWRAFAQEGTNAAIEELTADTGTFASVLATNVSVGTGLTAPSIVAATAISANSVLATNVSVGTGLTVPSIAATNVVIATAASIASVLATNVSVANVSIPSKLVEGGTVAITGGTAAVDTQANAVVGPVQILSCGTSSLNYWKLPVAAQGLCVNVINAGASTAGLVGHTAGVSFASATSTALATANAVGCAVDLVCDGTNWWKRQIDA